MGVKIVLQLLLVFVVSASFLLGVRRIALYGAEENKCDMTYMFEYPQYIVRREQISVFTMVF